jgi:hypothetical protein
VILLISASWVLGASSYLAAKFSTALVVVKSPFRPMGVPKRGLKIHPFYPSLGSRHPFGLFFLFGDRVSLYRAGWHQTSDPFT